MAKIGRNDPCPCGSGKKYKKCCGTVDREVPPGSRVVRRNGDEYLVSDGASDDAIDIAAEHFERRSGGGPAQQMLEYAQPLLDATDGSHEQLDRALKMGMLLWNVAVTKDEGERDQMLRDLADKMPDEAARREFRATAQHMMVRHRAMFPDLHR